MKVAIVGAGMTGAYLRRLLRDREHEVDIYDRGPGTRCGISPCAWGTSKGFSELLKHAGLDLGKYLLRRFEYLMMDEIRVKGEFETFDKPGVIKDLLQGVEVKRGKINPAEYDRVLDSTGVSRAFLPPLQNDLILPCVQWRIRSDAGRENRIKLGKIGYAWCFPLSENEYHVGCGSLLSDPRKITKELGWIETMTASSRGKILCACSGKIRITSPLFSQPFVMNHGPVQIWGVGEAIGCVAPLAGDGIVPGMRSAQLLLENWDDPEAYRTAILQEFKWMESERRVIGKLRMKESLGLKDAWVLKKNSRRMGIQVGVKEALLLIKNLR